jgi:hypothetical protein
MNADGDPKSLDMMGYFQKNKQMVEEQAGFILERRNPNARHLPEYKLVKFLDSECHKHLKPCEDSGGYYNTFFIELNQLIENQNESVFLKILLDAYNNNDLHYQLHSK